MERLELQTAHADAVATGEVITADLETAKERVDSLTEEISKLKIEHDSALHELAIAKTAAEQAAAVLRGSNDQMQTRIKDLHDLNEELKATIASLNADITSSDAIVANLTANHSVELHELTAARNNAERDAAVYDVLASKCVHDVVALNS